MKSFLFYCFLIIAFNSCNMNKTVPQDQLNNLHDIYVLTAIASDGLPIEFNLNELRKPTLELNITEMKMFGNDGCNDIFSAIENLDSTSISFGMIAGTKMFCPNMELPNAYTRALRTVRSYGRKDLSLIFFDENSKETLRFRKVD